MNRKQKKMLARILVSAALLLALHFIPVTGAARFVCYMAPYLIVGYDILIKAGKGIINRQVTDENFLMAVATVGAIALALYEGSGDYTEAIAVMLFYQIGEWFQSYAVGKSRRNISELMDIRPDYANLLRKLERIGRCRFLRRCDELELVVGSVMPCGNEIHLFVPCRNEVHVVVVVRICTSLCGWCRCRLGVPFMCR